jgi:hypothetical protein
MWRDILVANREEVLKQSQRFRQALDALEHVMREGNADALEDLIRGPAEGRAGWQMGAPRVPTGGSKSCRRAGHKVGRPLRRTMYDIPLSRPAAAARRGRHVRLPGSKSISNRVLLLAGLAEGVTAVHDLLDSDDTRVMLAALQRWAAGCARTGRCCTCGPGRPAARCTGQALPGQCRHRDAPAGGRAGGAGRHAGRRL